MNSKKFKKEFGKFLASERKLLGVTQTDLGYILNSRTIHTWEQGRRFPREMMTLKKIFALFKDTPYMMAELFNSRGIAPTEKEWDNFRRIVEAPHTGNISLTSKDLSERNHAYSFKDDRESECRKIFGEYLRASRLKHGITGLQLSKALGKFGNSTVSLWEAGDFFPSDVKDIALLDKLFGDTIKVIFGLCQKYGVKLTSEEIKELATRLNECRTV